MSRLTRYEGTFAVAQVAAGAGLPSWFSLDDAPFAAAVRRGGELSLVCPDAAVPGDVVAVERGWAALEVEGPMEFTLTGVLAGIAAPIADAGVPIFALATFDTDVVLVPGARADDAVAALRAAGHEVLA